jgi:hypothetical protein
MFNSKALWWTFLGFWMAGSIYWHVCKIEQYCDMLFDSQGLLPEMSRSKGTVQPFIEGYRLSCLSHRIHAFLAQGGSNSAKPCTSVAYPQTSSAGLSSPAYPSYDA